MTIPMPNTRFEEKFIAKIGKIGRDEIEQRLGQTLTERNSLYQVFQTLRDGLIVLQPNLTIEHVNDAARHLLGLGADRNLAGRRLPDVANHPAIHETVTRVLLMDERSAATEIELPGPPPRVLELQVLPLGSDTEGAGGSLLLAIRDTTDARRAEVSRHRAEKASAFTSLAAGLAHEIKNPLNSLQIHASLLNRTLKEAENSPKKADLARAAQSSDIIVEEIRRLNRVVNEFLAAVRPTTPNLQAMDVNSLCRRVADTLRPEADAHGIQLRLKLDPALPALPVAANQFLQMLMNLVKNSLEAIAGAPDAPHLRVIDTNPAGEDDGADARGRFVEIQTSLDGEHYTVRVTDNGPGIAEENRARILEPYFTTKDSGTGLGLSMVSRVVEEHAGKLAVHSEPGELTVMTLTFPVPIPSSRMIDHDAGGASPKE